MAIETLYPAIRPSLDLNFARSKSVDPRITFSRASAATYYDGKTVAKAEENLLTYSQEFDNAAWLTSGTAAVTANTASAPDGSVTADRILLSASSQKYQNKSVSGAVSVTMSVWAMSSTGVDQAFRLFGNDGTSNSPDLVATTSWQRFVFTYTAQSASVFAVGIRNAVSNSSSDILIWGAQLEQRSQVTAYTPTTTQPITNYIPVLQTAPAGVPRIDHDPITGECKGLLIEEQRVNLLAYSEQFDNGVWSKGGCTISANSGVSPDGMLTADLLVETTATGDHYVLESQAISWASGSQVTGSVFVKPKGRRYVRLLIGGSSSGWNAYCVFDLLTGSIGSPTSNSASITARSIIDLGNGWYRCSLSASPTVTSTAGAVFQVNAMQSVDVNATSYTGDGYSGIYVWGAQLEAGSFPTSYIKTEASQVTRAVDSASMTGANFTSWYRQGEGTLFADVEIGGTSSNGPWAFTISDGSIDNYLGTAQTTPGGKVCAYVRKSAIDQAVVGLLEPTTAGNSFASAMSYSANNVNGAINGSALAADTSALIPVGLTQASIGSISNSAQRYTGHIKRITYYPKALPGNLQALTT